ncbi:MAG: lysine--tRNA ligase [Chloroflexi bacterium]|nr:lysine--tRNA ligase [Chloroflexota bacterium]|tara:strand:+ start:139 stop:1593 length:1455 start_codon:yes stop_codon:yes gene_type:complete
MPNEEELINARKEKRNYLIQHGNPYPARVNASNAIDKIKSDFNIDDQSIYNINGRVTAKRKMGKVAFLDIRNESGKIQIQLKKEKLNEQYEILSLIDLGDFISASGLLFATKTDEITIAVEEINIISKALRPPPEKWHGVVDPEIRYRSRHLDLISNKRSKELAVAFSNTIFSLRSFFHKNGFIEMQTPVLQESAGGAAAKPFITHHNQLDQDLFLRISLELHLKRLLIGGFEKVFEIGKVFRNEGISYRHNPEFTLLESYQAYVDYKDVANMVKELITFCAQEVAGSLTIMNDEHEINLADNWQELTYVEALEKFAGLKYDAINNYADLKKQIQKLGMDIDINLSHDAMLDEIMKKFVEPQLIQPTFIFDYPTEISPLAKKIEGNERFVERFELFILGYEFANAYSELNDPVDQKERMIEQVKKANQSGDEVELIDEDFVEALEYGMPPAGGLGLGIERLAMLFTGEHSIREIILFPAMKSKE